MEALLNLLENLNLDYEPKEAIVKEIKKMQKQIDIAEFKYHRTDLDKDAITNVLNATIEDLESQRKVIEAARNEIELKNSKLGEAMDLIKEAQSQLIQSEKMASLGQLTAGVAHEINNPINFVSANIKPLKEDVADLLKIVSLYDQTIVDSKLEEHFLEVQSYKERLDWKIVIDEINHLLKGIEEGASRTTEIVKGLRNFSRLDQSDLKIASINEGLESTLVLLHSTHKDHIDIIRNFGEIPDIECYPGQLNQVFMNIISNAIQAIEHKGIIEISTSLLNDHIVISIKDNGKGMTEEVLKKVFDPFFTTKDVGKGTGLGLSISFGIIQKHNGKIDLKSTPGLGSEFIISLPIKNNNYGK